MGSGFVTITISDGGAGQVVVPANEVQAVFGVSSAGTANQPYATRSLSALQSVFGYGPLVEAAALTILAGGTVIATKLTQTAAGIALTPTFTNPLVTTGTATPSVTCAAVIGAYDDMFIQVKITTGGILGTAGIQFQVSIDGGRNYGPILSLGTALSYLIPNVGITVVFGVGTATLLINDTIKFQTIAPYYSTASVQTGLAALAASVYGTTGWGSMHIVGGTSTGTGTYAPGIPGADATTINGYLEALVLTGSIYSSCIISSRDNKSLATWGGAGETEAAWTTAILADYAAQNAARLCVGAGSRNMPSAYSNLTVFGAPRPRRPIAWAAAARRVQVPPQRMISRVKDGALSQIIVDSANDPIDGFIYHDERANPGLDYKIAGTGGRFMASMTRPKMNGVYISHPLIHAALGSSFWALPQRDVMDFACTIAQVKGQEEIDDDIRLNTDGTVFENDALNIEMAIQQEIADQMLSQSMLSPPGAKVVVDRVANVRSLGNVPITITIYGKGYILSMSITIAYNNASVAS